MKLTKQSQLIILVMSMVMLVGFGLVMHKQLGPCLAVVWLLRPLWSASLGIVLIMVLLNHHPHTPLMGWLVLIITVLMNGLSIWFNYPHHEYLIMGISATMLLLVPFTPKLRKLLN